MIPMQAMLLAVSLSVPASGPAPRLEELLAAGDPSAPVQVVLYVSLDREAQRELASSLYREIEAGRLKRKVRLSLRPVVAGPEDAIARALIAAAGQGRLWPYVLSLGWVGRPLQEPILRRAADRAGLDGDCFDLALQDRETDLLLDGLRRDRATSTPGAFVGARRLPGALTCDGLVEALLAEHRRLAR